MNRWLRGLLALIAAYLLLLAVHAWLGAWTPEFLKGRDLWHFYLTRMIVPMVMLGVLASFSRVLASALLLSALLLFVGAVSAIKKHVTGEPFQVSDLFIASQGTALFNYVETWRWIFALLPLPALVWYVRNWRFRAWSLPLAALCIGLLSTYRFEPVVKFIHDNMAPWGLENLTFSQAESERMNGLATHLYFSTAGVRLKTFNPDQVKAALAQLSALPLGPVSQEKPDIYIVLGEAWWHDPGDANSPFARLQPLGIAEGRAVSPVYGGTTPNAEFEVLTSVSMRQFPSGIIPFQHYSPYFGEVRALPRLLREIGYSARAYHNFTRRYWLRDKVYPAFGFEGFDSGEEMGLATIADHWPKDAPLFDWVLKQQKGQGPEFHYIVTVSTHGAYAPGDACGPIGNTGICDYRARLDAAVADFAAFAKQVEARGRPYVIFAFGDHLPDLRDYQKSLGILDDRDPRLHEAPFFVASSTAGLAANIRERIEGRPYTCFAPVLIDALGLGVRDPYLRHMAGQCAAGTPAPVTEEILQRQLFEKRG